MSQSQYLSLYLECLSFLDRIEEVFLWDQLWLDLDEVDELFSSGLACGCVDLGNIPESVPPGSTGSDPESLLAFHCPVEL